MPINVSFRSCVYAYCYSDPSKLDKLAAELLLSSAVSKKRASPSPPPPLSIEEFYRQQKLLKKHMYVINVLDNTNNSEIPLQALHLQNVCKSLLSLKNTSVKSHKQ